MPALLSDISVLKGVGDRKRKLFRNLGINTVGDLISYFPRKYEDRTVFKTINTAIPGEYVCISATVAVTPVVNRVKGGLELLKFKVFDDSGSLDITYFRATYLRDRFEIGKTYIFYGRVEEDRFKKSLINPEFEPEESRGIVTGHLIPIYKQTAGLTSKNISALVRQAMDSLTEEYPTYLNEIIENKYGFPDVKESYRKIHFPNSLQEAETARRRFIFEELYVFTCSLNSLRKKREDEYAEKINQSDFLEFYSSLPYEPTNAQKKAISEASGDMAKGVPMKRLLQGDVGSGKTLVAAALAWSAIRSGYQTAFMAPTDLLSRQHLVTMKAFLERFNIRVGLLTATMKTSEKKAVKEALAKGEIDLIVGTHALLSDDVMFHHLGLVITDEQHRFGVRQRSKLGEKTVSPHTLVMSATPIPRTLALTIYGELETSVLNELPNGRQIVSTFLVNESYRERLNGFIRKNCNEGHQVYIVCPMIDENETMDNLHSAEKVFENIKSVFPDIPCGLCHGKQKPHDREEVMSSFFENRIKILVSTTVIEVGVDVPNSTLMIIENAERFGLSQLHQLRGRVGRGKDKSYCILISDSKSEESRKRLEVLCNTNDGFKISEADLEQRGPGDFFGSRQHGLPEFKIADLCGNMEFLKSSQEEAFETLKLDPELDSPDNQALKGAVLRIVANMTNTIN